MTCDVPDALLEDLNSAFPGQFLPVSDPDLVYKLKEAQEEVKKLKKQIEILKRPISKEKK
jgi:N-acetyl-beta-hexosaminidase